MAPRQNLPIILDYGDGRPLRAVTRTLDRSGLSFYIDTEMPVPGLGHEISFEARIGGGGARGRARVVHVDHVDDGVGREMVALCEVLELHGAAERVIARAGFRERVVEFAAKHRDGDKILEAAGGGLTRRLRPDTTPLRPREAHWIPEPHQPKTETPPPAPEHGPAPEGVPHQRLSKPKPPGRTRPTRPGRHHWEVDNRFKRGS
jgi:hypothetical protein